MDPMQENVIRIMTLMNAVGGKRPEPVYLGQQQQQSQGIDPMSMMSQFKGGGSGELGSSMMPSQASGTASSTASTTGGAPAGGGLGAFGIGAIIAAAIAAQHGMSNATNTTINGQKTDDAFAGNFGTEPFLGYLGDKWGWEPSIGERFDADIKNKDYGNAFMKSFGTANYWANPAQYLAYDTMKNTMGKTPAAIMDPISWMFEKW